jgi:hypothetical protein
VSDVIDYIENDPEWRRRMSPLPMPTQIFTLKPDHDYSGELCSGIAECDDDHNEESSFLGVRLNDPFYVNYLGTGNHLGRAYDDR